MPLSPPPSDLPHSDRPPASRAALLSLNATPPQLSETLHTLLRAHSHLTHSLSASAPPWPALVPSLTSLQHALSVTQRSPSPGPPTAEYPNPLSHSLALSNQLASKLSLLSSTRTFLTLASPPPKSTPLLQRARRLRDARDAAALPALASIPALDKPRTDLVARHNALRQELDDALRNAVFTPHCLRFHPPPDFPDDEDDVSLSAPSLRTPSPSPEQTPDPALVLAADTLSGAGHSARLLADAAPHSLATALRNAAHADGLTNPATVTSLASSSFTASAAPATSSMRSASTNRPIAPSHAPTPSPTASPRAIGLFARDEHLAQRSVCQAVFERVVAMLTGVLRRLAALAASVAHDAVGMDRAVTETWASAQRLLARFARALLGVPEADNDDEQEDEQEISVTKSGLSLLPRRPGTAAPSGGAAYRTYAWAFERGSAYQDSFEALVANIPTLSPNIYNLEVVYAPLQHFIGNTGRLLHAWQHTDDVASVLSGVEAEYAILPAFVSKAVHTFVKTVRNDVRTYIEDAFGNRAGTLLQPPSMEKMREQAQMPGSMSRYVLPALSQTQMLLDVIGSCLSLCIAVPTVARQLGEVINNEVIKPFSERAIYALDLAESWTDAGPLFKEIRTAANPTDENQKTNINGTNGYTRRNGLRRSRTWNAKALRTIRRRPDLTTTCLSRIYDKKNHLAREKPVRLLNEREWNAVVRLVANAKIVIAELENCASTEEEWKPTGAASQSSAISQESISILRLRAALCDHGASAVHQRAVIEAIGRTRSGCRMLREEVVERGIAVLHTEVVLRCFSDVIQTLAINMDAKKVSHTKNSNAGNDECLSKTASIFNTANLQLSDVERSSEDTSVVMCEYDEFGDRIANETVTDAEIEDYGFPSSSIFEPTEWKSPPRDGSVRFSVDDIILNAAHTQALTEADRRIVTQGQQFGAELCSKDEVIKWNLSPRERRFIFCEADGGVAAGIRVAGELSGGADRDVASGARLFLDAAATTGAEAFGWPVVESDYSITEGASTSATECRALLYAAGLM